MEQWARSVMFSSRQAQPLRYVGFKRNKSNSKRYFRLRHDDLGLCFLVILALCSGFWGVRKQKVYHVDVELDQLLTSFRLTFANLLAFLAKEILDHMPVEMNTLIQSILFLSGKIEHLPGRRKVCINKNKKDPKFMEKLSNGLSKLNALKIRHPSGAIYEFALN